MNHVNHDKDNIKTEFFKPSHKSIAYILENLSPMYYQENK